MQEWLTAVRKSILFEGFTEEEILKYIEFNRATIEEFGKDELVFMSGDEPENLFILLSGAVQVEKLESNGKRHIINQFKIPGTVFGEVYLYLGDQGYDYSCRAYKKAKVLCLPKDGVDFKKAHNELNQRLANNMLKILSHKAYYLNQKLIVHASFSLRQKIARYFLQVAKDKTYFTLNLNREELADYIGTTRPSLSRELMAMQEEGYLQIDRENVKIKREKIKELL